MSVGRGVLVVCLVATACSKEPSTAKEDKSTLAVTLTGVPNFAGNSVRIVGDRTPDAEPKYPCISNFDECLNFEDSDGFVSLDDLCPSSDYPHGTWDFTYTIYTAPGCGGQAITDGATDFNFVCYDSQDIFTRANPNQTLDENLDPGLNHNFIICLTENAEKTFDFNVCVIESDSASELVLDCGCTDSGTECSCPQNITNLESGCSVSFANACNVVCQ